MTSRYSLCLLTVVCMGLTGAAVAQLTNPSFETGDLTGWTEYGVGVDEVYEFTPAFGTAAPPPDGTHAVSTVVSGGDADDKPGGLYQRVAWSNATAWARVSFTNCLESSEFAGIRVGIDPTGGTSPQSAAVIWSTAFSSVNSFGQPNAERAQWHEASVMVSGISSGFITVFVQNQLNIRPHGGWKMLNFDNVRLTPAPDALPTNLGFETGNLEGWFSRLPYGLLGGDQFDVMQALIPAMMSIGDKGASEGTYYNEAIEGWTAHKDALIGQRFSTDVGNGPSAQVRATVDINTAGGISPEPNGFIRLGLNPTGNTDPAAGNTVWGNFETRNAWQPIELTINNAGPVVTLFIERRHNWGFELTRSAFDNVRLFFNGVEYFEQGGPTPTPRCPAGTDIDGDNVCDAQEVANVLITGNPNATNRILPDSDGDGLLDGEEDLNGNGIWEPELGETNPRNPDTDGDGFEDGLEVFFMGTDPLDGGDPGVAFVDADGDGLPASIDPNDNNRDIDGDRYDDLYDAVTFRDLAAASDASRVPNLGDVNGDAEAGNLDSLVIQALFLNSIDHTNPVFQQGGEGYDGFRYANPSRNGQAGNLDSLLIQAHFLGNLQTFPLRF